MKPQLLAQRLGELPWPPAVCVSTWGDVCRRKPRSALGQASLASHCQVASGPLEAGEQLPELDEASCCFIVSEASFSNPLSGSLSVIGAF